MPKRWALVVALGASCGLAVAQDSNEPAGVARVRQRAAELSRELESIRGQKFAHPVEIVPRTVAEYRAIYEAEALESSPAEHSRRLSRAFSRIGLLPAGYDLHASGVEATVVATTAAFERKGGAIAILRPEETDHLIEYGLFTALCYAQQYQRTDMSKYFNDGNPDRDDILEARRFLSEGEATYLENYREAKAQGAEGVIPDQLDALAALTRSEFAELQRQHARADGERGKPSLGAEERSAKFPAFVYHSTCDPALKGAALVGKLVRTGGWAAVDELWKHPPSSTAQVLHRKKLAAPREEPIRLELPDLSSVLGAGVRRSVDYSMGELGLRSFLEEEGVGEKESLALAKGWRGDRLVAFEKEGAAADASETTVAWVATWENEDGARKLFEALAPALDKRSPGKCAFTRTGSDLFLVVSSSETLPALAKTLASETKKVAPGK